ncbi:hypothetical protein EZY14_015975 [Kordia sp. TARA_039_SRF]|nr:hypothetical protein EZY14_015975 [Kordia sp. TARA_039_SRF]
MAKLLNNLPVEDLTQENDYLGVIDKAELIKTILKNNTEKFKEIKMFVLYGDWGSGKSTLMKYLESALENDFNTFFFDTWQFEKDDNLPKTLLDFLLKESEGLGEKISGDILKFGAKLFRGLGKSVKIKVPLFPKGPSVDFNPSEFVKEFEKQDISFYEAKQNFKIEFKRWEDNITKEKSQEYNIIFIDDLDRCEPENVLNLLSAIKLFFTYGKKTIFFFGVDKKAVQQAIQTKYKDAVKSEEYLEKIFDISFSMPKHESVLKLVSQYFDEKLIVSSSKNKDVNRVKLNELVADFFRKLHFTNPRKLKKVLNKYVLLANAKENLDINHPFSKYIGNIYAEGADGNYFETILSLYFIAVKESNPQLFKRLFDLKLKEKSFKGNFIEMSKLTQMDSWMSIQELIFESYLGKELNSIFNQRILPEKNTSFLKLTFVFCPENLMAIDSDFGINDDIPKSIQLEEKRIDYYFLKYLCNNIKFFNELPNPSYSDKSISDIYQGVKQIL